MTGVASYCIMTDAGFFGHIVSEWWNGQTRTFEGRIRNWVRVQVPPPTPVLYARIECFSLIETSLFRSVTDCIVGYCFLKINRIRLGRQAGRPTGYV